jgi:hypothetical protein
MRDIDLPRHKETIASSMFGEALARPSIAGYKKGKEYEYTIKPLLECSTKILWLDQINDEYQITVVIRSLDCTAEMGVVDKRTREVVHRERTDELRYLISSGTSIELTEGSRKKFNAFLESFDLYFGKLVKGEELHGL